MNKYKLPTKLIKNC